MSVHMLVMYDLLPGVDPKDFAEWSRTVDQPACRAFDACESFEVYIVSSQEGFGARYQVVEDIRAASAEAWQVAVNSPGHTRVMDEWGRYGVEASVLTLYVEPT